MRSNGEVTADGDTALYLGERIVEIVVLNDVSVTAHVEVAVCADRYHC